MWSWLLACIVFFFLSGLLGGPTEGDAALSVYSTWAIAHAHFACAYPPIGKVHINVIANPFALVAPLYPVITGALAALLRIGHKVPYPSTAQLGHNCGNAFWSMYHWSAKSSSILPTIRLSYVVWIVLLAGAVLLVRAAGRGNTMAEPAAVVLLAVTTPVLACIVD
ncbi:MAG: hypothetical protein ACREGR_01435, partial [Minisyncoccia bacterium]